jgi:type II secretory pathway component GspD/PulD (secretin)
MGGGMMGGSMGGGGMMGGSMGGGGMMGGMMGGGGGMAGMSLSNLIQETVEPDSWFYNSDLGEGTITLYPQQSPKKLVILATREVHRKVDTLLNDIRKSLGNQVSIEARFLAVSENFLEDIGVDMDLLVDTGNSKWGQIAFDQASDVSTKANITSVPGSIGGIASAMNVTGGYGTILDNLQVQYLLHAAQGRKDSKTLSEPKATVMSGESAMFTMNGNGFFPLPPTVQSGQTTQGLGTNQTQTQTVQPQLMTLTTGSNLTIAPTITKDKKHVLLNIVTTQNEFLGAKTQRIEAALPTAGGGVEVTTWDITTPELENTSIMTRVSVPDGGTLLLGGVKITAEIEKEVGVPILSKIPMIGTLFSNRSKVRDRKVLLILVKPTILIQDETDQEALGEPLVDGQVF